MHAILLLILLVGSNGERVRKASRSSLDKVKKLLNEETERQQSAIQSDSAVDFFADIRRDPKEKGHHDELAVNNIEDYFQGDVDLSEGQVDQIARDIEAVHEGLNRASTRAKRKVGKAPLYKRWKKGQAISFDFDGSIPPETRNRIRTAMRLWQRNTCIRFEENGPTVDRLEFYDGGGCSSFVGRIGGTQGVSISTPGCDVVGIISHEIGHALGIFHEQARPDQERYIAVNYNNIPISRWNNFQPVDDGHADLLGLPYDAGSVMHYGAFGFATDPYIPTIRTNDRNLQKTIGQRAGPAFLDFEAINLAYDCQDRCQKPVPNCQRGGYVHPNNCSTCMCPDGLAGTLCANVRLSTGPCGGVFRANKTPQFVSSPNYPHYYPANVECYWMLQARPLAEPGGRVFFEFVDEMDFALCEDSCDKSYVEIKYQDDFRLTGARFCCPGHPKKPFVSFSNEMMILMRGFGGAGKGFRARFWSDRGDEPVTRHPVMVTAVTTTRPPLVFTMPSTPRPPPMTLPTLPPFTLPTFPPPPPPTAPPSPPTITTTLPTTTTQRPVIETTKGFIPGGKEEPGGNIPVHDCGCGVWSEWEGECSQECGGCGSRTRKRACDKDDQCQTLEKRPCNFNACPQGTNFLLNNGEVHLLWRGCCIGLFRSGDKCSSLENSNPLLKILSDLLKANDAYSHATGGEPPRIGAPITA